jgi:hypothetical protein
MVTGYMILLPADIEVCIADNGDVDVFYNPQLTFKVVEKRGFLTEQNQGYGMPNPIGTIPLMFAWSALFGIGTDKADSVLVTHPLNRYDLPFVTTSGIIDSGYNNKAGNIPFFIKEGFSGIIPKGTPIAQVIPFKRDKWKMEIGSEEDLNEQKKSSNKISRKFFDAYKNEFRQIKEYK